ITYRHGIGGRSEWRVTAGRESIGSLAVVAAPANGGFRPNPALGGPGVDLVQLGLERRSEGFAVRRDLHLETMLEGGRQDGGATYLRLSGAGHVLFPVGATRMLVRAQGGVAFEGRGVVRWGVGVGGGMERGGVGFGGAGGLWGVLWRRLVEVVEDGGGWGRLGRGRFGRLAEVGGG